MKKYKQTFIPSVKTGIIKLNPKSVREYYAIHLQGKSVVNLATNITINFTSDGKGKIGSNKVMHPPKIAVVQKLQQILEVAEFNNFGQRKENDKQSILGYLNFKAKVKIDGKIENLRIAVVMKTDGKVYYNHEINKIVFYKK